MRFWDEADPLNRPEFTVEMLNNVAETLRESQIKPDEDGCYRGHFFTEAHLLRYAQYYLDCPIHFMGMVWPLKRRTYRILKKAGWDMRQFSKNPWLWRLRP